MACRLFLAFSAFIVALLSCNGKDEPIPAYIKIDSVSIKTTVLQGNNVHQIEAVYVYSPNQLLGIFELPAVIPILEEGLTNIRIVPAIYLNGSSNQLTPHTGFLPLDTNLNLIRGKVAVLSNATFQYRPNIKMEWIEDFEDNSSTLVVIGLTKSDTGLITSEIFDLKGRFTSLSNVYTVKLSASDTNKTWDIGSFKTFENLPVDGSDIFLEFDLKSDVPVQLALSRSSSSGAAYIPYLYIFETNNQWKHFYVNLVFEIGGQSADNKYKILFGSDIRKSSTDRKVHIDNIRLSYIN